MKVAKEIAEAEVGKWLDYKRKSAGHRAKFANSIESLVDAVCEGDLVINEDFTIKQILREPIQDKEGNPVVKELVFKARIKTETVQSHCQGVKSDDGDGRINAHIAALTSNPKELIKKMDYDDYNISAIIITVFF